MRIIRVCAQKRSKKHIWCTRAMTTLLIPVQICLVAIYSFATAHTYLVQQTTKIIGQMQILNTNPKHLVSILKIIHMLAIIRFKSQLL